MEEYLEAEWQTYLAKVIGRYERGEISQETYRRLANKVVSWVEYALEKGVVSNG